MGAAGVPEEARGPKAKGEVAPDRLDRVRAEGLAGGAVVADARCRGAGEFRAGLAARGRRYAAGVMPTTVVFPEESGGPARAGGWCWRRTSPGGSRWASWAGGGPAG
ncbi:transposase [bacterium]|nr:transposase [bacterium]